VPPTFRIAADSDADFLLGMMQEYYVYDGHAFDRSRARAALLTFLREPSFGRAWLICDGEVAVGYIVLTFGYSLEYLGRDAFIDEFFLRESHPGRGWAGKPSTSSRSRPAQPASAPSIWKSCAPIPGRKMSTAAQATRTTSTTSCRSGSNAASPSPALVPLGAP